MLGNIDSGYFKAASKKNPLKLLTSTASRNKGNCLLLLDRITPSFGTIMFQEHSKATAHSSANSIEGAPQPQELSKSSLSQLTHSVFFCLLLILFFFSLPNSTPNRFQTKRERKDFYQPEQRRPQPTSRRSSSAVRH